MTKVWCKLCNKIIQTGEWPTDWMRSVFVAIPKIYQAPLIVQNIAQLHSSATPAKYYYTNLVPTDTQALTGPDVE